MKWQNNPKYDNLSTQAVSLTAFYELFFLTPSLTEYRKNLIRTPSALTKSRIKVSVHEKLLIDSY